MAGSALGCFALFPFMPCWRGSRFSLAVLGALAALAGLLLALEASDRRLRRVPRRRRPPLSRRCSFRLGADAVRARSGTTCSASLPRTYVRTHPGTSASFSPTRDFHGWDPVSRVEVFTFPDDFGVLNGSTPIKLVTQDGGAGTILIDFGGNEDALAAWTERTVYATGYFLKAEPRARPRRGPGRRRGRRDCAGGTAPAT